MFSNKNHGKQPSSASQPCDSLIGSVGASNLPQIFLMTTKQSETLDSINDHQQIDNNHKSIQEPGDLTVPNTKPLLLEPFPLPELFPEPLARPLPASSEGSDSDDSSL